MEFRFATIGEILPLREAVIIAGTGREPYFPGDDDPATRHVGVFENGRCIGCATFLRKDHEGRPARQLRGMATEPAWQRQGIGRQLLAFAEAQFAAEGDIALLWCNARLTAVPFYEKAGWSVDSDVFDIPAVGPHRRMVQPLTMP
ncbi:MAG: hypothetical protein QG656_470 [Candidatus Hydrogenedentes bacterium]|nr:hypothetical protein [Candidatus Hydrogenedentota bacterium]